jgi:hypothetical protein
VSAFEFLFSFYGLLLGLSIAELAGGFSRLWDRRALHGVGWMAPLLGVIVLADLTSFWTNVWFLRDSIEVRYSIAFCAAVITLLYYFAASQVFPRDGSTSPPDEHVMAHRKAVVTAAILSNVLALFGAYVLAGAKAGPLVVTLLMNIPLFVLLAAIGWLPGRRAVIAAMLVTLPVTVFYEPIVFAIAGLFR